MLIAFLTDQQLTVVTGTPGMPARVEALHTLRLPKGCVRKGQIMSPDGFKSSVQNFWSDNELPTADVKLVLDNKRFVVRTIDMPRMKKEADQRAYLRRELQSTARLSEPVFTYRIIRENRAEHTCTALVNMLEKASVENVVKAFAAAGVEVTALTSPYAAVNSYIARLEPTHKNKTALFLSASKEKSSAFLYVNGEYLYSTEQHLFTEYGTADFAGELVRSVSNIEQFVQTQHLEDPIGTILLLGFTVPASEVTRTALLEHNPSFEVDDIRMDQMVTNDSAITPDELFAELPAVLGLCVPEDGTQIIESWKDASGQNNAKHTRNALLHAVIPAAVALGVCVVAIIALNVWNMGTQGRIDAANDYMMNPANTEAIQAYQKAHADNQTAHETSDSAGKLQGALASYPEPGAKIERAIAKCAKGLVDYDAVSYDASTGEYVIGLTTKNDDKIWSFVHRLQKRDDLFSVDFNGYEGNEVTTTTPGKTTKEYTAQVTLTLAEGAGE